MELKQFLKQWAFDRFGEPEIAQLTALMTMSMYPNGHVFIAQGQQGEAMYLLVEGAVEVRRADEASGEPQEGAELRSGELFGLLSLIDDMPASATCTAKGAVTAAALSREGFEKLFEAAPPIGHHLQYMVAVQLARDLQERNKALRKLLLRHKAVA
jgi:CRP/FNR family transcriptional regulator, cyclic AMP receptor protein